jgi:hypothetical protein
MWKWRLAVREEMFSFVKSDDYPREERGIQE